MSILQSLKDAKRRGVETLMQAIGASAVDVDEEYNQSQQLLRMLSDDTNEIGAALSAYLTSQKQHVAIASELGTVMHRMYKEENAANEGAHGMNLSEVSVDLQQLWADIHGNYRPSAAKVLKDFSIDPLRECTTVSIPEVQGLCSERDQLAKDYGSYRRRLAKLDKPNLTEVEAAEKTKLEGKLVTAEQTFHTSNESAKKEISQLKVVRDSMVELSIVYLAVCQADFYERSAARFKEMLATLPQDRVQHARTQINNFVRQGGPPRKETEVSNTQKAWMVASGKALPSDFQTSNEQQEAELMEASKARRRAMDMVQEDTHSSQHALNNRPAPPPTTTATASSAVAHGHAPFSSVSSKSPSSSVQQKRNTNSTSTNSFSSAKSNGSSVTATQSRPGLPKWPPQQNSAAPESESPVGQNSTPVARAVSASVAPTAPVAPPAPPPPPPKVLKQVRALYRNEPDEDDELPFEAGDIIEVLEKIDEGWWKGKCNSKEGLFPTNYVEALA